MIIKLNNVKTIILNLTKNTFSFYNNYYFTSKPLRYLILAICKSTEITKILNFNDKVFLKKGKNILDVFLLFMQNSQLTQL